METSLSKKDNNRILVLIILILVAGIAMRFYKFGILLDSVQSDEMGTAYDAWSLLNYGVDRYQKSWPVYFNNFGLHGQSALMTYLCLVCFKVFGYGRFALRFPALLVSALAAVFGVGVFGEIFEEKKRIYQLVFAFLYAVSPYTFMASRFALDCNLMFGMSTIFLYFLIKAYKSEKLWVYFLAGLFAGLVLYTYSISYIVMPLMLLLSIIYMIYTSKVRFIQALVFVIPLAILALPLMLVQIINVFDLPEFMLGPITIIRITGYGGSDVSFNDFFLGIVRGFAVSVGFDDIAYNSDPRFFNFYPMSIPFYLIGLVVLFKSVVRAIKEKEPLCEVFVAIWFICEVLASGLMVDPNVNRMNGILFAVMFFMTTGFVWTFEKLKENAAKIFCIGCAAVYLVYFGVFIYTYFTEIGYAECTTSSMCPEAFEFIDDHEEFSGKVVASNIPPASYAASRLPAPGQIDEMGNYSDDLYTCYSFYGYETLREYLYNEGGVDKLYLVYRPTEDDMQLFDELEASKEQFGTNFYLYFWE